MKKNNREKVEVKDLKINTVYYSEYKNDTLMRFVSTIAELPRFDSPDWIEKDSYDIDKKELTTEERLDANVIKWFVPTKKDLKIYRKCVNKANNPFKDKFNYKKAYKKLSKRIAFLENNDTDFLTQNFSIENLEKKAEKEKENRKVKVDSFGNKISPYLDGFNFGNEKERSGTNIIIIDDMHDHKLSSEAVNKIFESTLKARKNKREPYFIFQTKEPDLISLFAKPKIESVEAIEHLVKELDEKVQEKTKLTALENVIKNKDIQIEAQKRKINNLNIAVRKKRNFDIKEKLQESINKSALNHVEIKDMVKGEVYSVLKNGELYSILTFSSIKEDVSSFGFGLNFDTGNLYSDFFIRDSKFIFRKADKIEVLHLQTAEKLNMFLSIDLFKKLIDNGLTE